VGRDDLAHTEQGISLARGVLVGGGVTVGGVGLALELLQILFGAVVGPVDIAACEVDRGVNRNPYGPPDTRSCSGPQQSPIPLLMVFGGGIVAITGAAISNDAASPEERETLARDYNLRLRETSGQARLAPTPAVTVGLSAAAVPQGGLLVLRGRF
jgi:hypothetical protein